MKIAIPLISMAKLLFGEGEMFMILSKMMKGVCVTDVAESKTMVSNIYKSLFHDAGNFEPYYLHGDFFKIVKDVCAWKRVYIA